MSGADTGHVTCVVLAASLKALGIEWEADKGLYPMDILGEAEAYRIHDVCVVFK